MLATLGAKASNRESHGLFFPAEVTSGRRCTQSQAVSLLFGFQCSTDTHARAQGPVLPIIFDIDGLLISETPPGRDVDGVREQRARLEGFLCN